MSYFDRVLCGTTTIEVTGGNGTSYDWQTTGGVSANSTTSTSSISASSDGTIKVYPVSACGSAVGTDNYALMNIKKVHLEHLLFWQMEMAIVL